MWDPHIWASVKQWYISWFFATFKNLGHFGIALGKSGIFGLFLAILTKFWILFVNYNSILFFLKRASKDFGRVLQPRIGGLVKQWYTSWYTSIWKNNSPSLKTSAKLTRKQSWTLWVSWFVEHARKHVQQLSHIHMVRPDFLLRKFGIFFEYLIEC